MSATNGICRSSAKPCSALEIGGHCSLGRRQIGTGPSVPCMLAAEVLVGLELAEERQHVVPAPAGGAKLLPFGVVVGRAAERHHAHHRGAAAHDAALRIAGERRIAGEPPVHLQLRPEIGGVVVGRRIGIEHVGGLAAGRRVAAGFEQQHGMARARREPVRQHAAGGAAADDDGVETVGHGFPRGRLLRPCGNSSMPHREGKEPTTMTTAAVGCHNRRKA